MRWEPRVESKSKRKQSVMQNISRVLTSYLKDKLQPEHLMKIGGACLVVKQIDTLFYAEKDLKDKTAYSLQDVHTVFHDNFDFMPDKLVLASKEFLRVFKEYFWVHIVRISHKPVSLKSLDSTTLTLLHYAEHLIELMKNKCVHYCSSLHVEVMSTLLNTLCKFQETLSMLQENIHLNTRDMLLTGHKSSCIMSCY